MYYKIGVGLQFSWHVAPFVTENEKKSGKGEFVKPLNCFLYAAASALLPVWT